MKRLCLLAACLLLGTIPEGLRAQLLSAEADARVGTLVSAGDYGTLAEELPALRDSVSPPLRALADALAEYRRGRPAESNAALERLAAYGETFGPGLLRDMQQLAVYNCWTLGDYAGAERALRLLSGADGDAAAPSVDGVMRWLSALDGRPAPSVRRPEGEIILPVGFVPVGRGEHLVVEADVNGRTEPVIFDTGCSYANFVSAAAAERMGLRILADSIPVTGMSAGLARLGVADSMRIGPLTVLHPTFLVVDRLANGRDDLLEAVLGTDIIRALGEIRIESARGRIVLPAVPSAAPEKPNLAFSAGRYYLTCTGDGDPLLLHFDTGNVKSTLSMRYFGRHARKVRAEGRRSVSVQGGFGGVKSLKVFVLPEMTLDLPQHPVVLRDVDVSIREKGLASEQEDEDGSLGVDLLRAADAVTFDLGRMFLRTE